MSITKRQELPTLPAESQLDRSTCASCVAACCLKNTVLALSSPEADMMVKHGVQLRELPKEESQGHKPGFRRKNYLLEEDCANLVENDAGQRVCSIYEKRPSVCRDFEEGGLNCMIFRAARIPKDSVAS